ncbi:MAG: hypothetical protein WC587_01870 [Candidatus Paceibacterota bacterium]
MEKFGENFGQAENALEQPKMSQEIFERLIGAQIDGIRDFFDGGNAEDWIDNFKDKLGEIEKLADTVEAIEFYGKSAQESAMLAIGNMKKNLDSLDSDKLSKDVKEALLKSLNNLFN